MSAQDRLAAAIGEAQAARTRADRAGAVASVLRDGELMQDLGFALLEDPDGVAGLLVEFGGLPGLDAPVRQLKRRIEEIATDRRRASLRLADPDEAPRPQQFGDLPPLLIPPGYVVKMGGVWEVRGHADEPELSRLAHRPILPSQLLTDCDTGERSIRLEWHERGQWSGRVLRASTVQDPRTFVRLRDAGAPVAAHTAAPLAKFLDAVEEGNADALPRAWVTRRMGWLDGGRLGFALGSEVIGGEGRVTIDLDAEGSESQIAEALRAGGDEDEWVEAIRLVTGHPAAMLAVYASIAAPLLDVLPSAPNPILGWSGETSTGKTTILRLAASVWGDPDERGNGLVQKWNQTATYLERIAAFARGLPCCLDDTNDVPTVQRDMIPRMLYQFAGGKGRGRGKPDGTRRTETWRSPLLSTGEAALTSYSQDAGTRARVLVLSEPPFGRTPQESLVADLAERSCKHFGHFGPRIVRYLLDHRKTWPRIAEEYRASCAAYAGKAERHATKRLGASCALLDLARRLGEACGLPAATCDPIGHAWAAAQASGADSDRPLAALQAVYGWAVAHSVEFWGHHLADRDGTARQPAIGWAGAWAREGADRIAFNPDCLDRVLAHHGYDPGAVVPLWQERGWLVTSEGRRTCRVSVNGKKARCVGITMQAIRECAE